MMMMKIQWLEVNGAEKLQLHLQQQQRLLLLWGGIFLNNQDRCR